VLHADHHSLGCHTSLDAPTAFSQPTHADVPTRLPPAIWSCPYYTPLIVPWPHVPASPPPEPPADLAAPHRRSAPAASPPCPTPQPQSHSSAGGQAGRQAGRGAGRQAGGPGDTIQGGWERLEEATGLALGSGLGPMNRRSGLCSTTHHSTTTNLRGRLPAAGAFRWPKAWCGSSCCAPRWLPAGSACH